MEFRTAILFAISAFTTKATSRSKLAILVSLMLCTLACCTELRGQALPGALQSTQTGAHSPSNKAIVDLVSDLASPRFNVRRKSFLELRNTGQPAIKQVRDAVLSRRQTVSRSAAKLENLLLQPDELNSQDVETVFSLLNNPSVTSVTRLCKLGYWDAATLMLDYHAGIRASDSLQGTSRASNLHTIVKLATQQGDPTLAWPIIELATSSDDSDYQSRKVASWLAAKLDLKRQAPTDSPDAKALDAWYRGEVDTALKLARDLGLQQELQSRTYRWGQLSTPEFTKVALPRLSSQSRAVAQAVLLELAGETNAAQTQWQEVLGDDSLAPFDLPFDLPFAADPSTAKTTDEALRELLQNAPPAEQNLLVLCMLLSGRVQPVLHYVEKSNPFHAFDFYASRNNYAKALQLVGLNAELSNFATWIENQEKMLRIEGSGRTQRRLSPLFRQTSRTCNILSSLGYQDESRQLFAVIADCADTQLAIWETSILPWLSSSEMRAAILADIDPVYRRARNGTRQAIRNELFADLSNSIEYLLETFPQNSQHVGEGTTVWTALERLEAWDNAFFASVGISSETWLLDATRAAKTKSAREQRDLVLPMRELARLAKGCGHRELALELSLSDAGLQSEFDAPLHNQIAAELYIEEGRYEEGAALLAGIRKATRSNEDPARIHQEVQANLYAGQMQQAERLWQTQWLSPRSGYRWSQGPSYSLVIRDLPESANAVAKEYAQTAYLLAPFGSPDFYWAANDYANILEDEDRMVESANVLRSTFVEALHSNSTLLPFQSAYGHFHYLNLSVKAERIRRAAACIENGDIENASRHMRVGQHLQPQDIEMVVQCYPRLSELGYEQEANELFESYEKTMFAHLKDWPNDAMANNNLAWMYSQCDRKLDQALRLAQKAVSLAPRSATYMDTLSEIHYRAGRTSEAIAAMKSCIQLDPHDIHFRKNLMRFANGAP